MRKIGLLGGMSWESTALYYRDPQRGGARAPRRLPLGAACCCPPSTSPRSRPCRPRATGTRPAALLAAEAAALEAAGAECVVLCTNTMHKVADAIEAAVGVPLLHIADVTADAVRGAGLSTGSRCSARGSPWSRPSCADRLRHARRRGARPAGRGPRARARGDLRRARATASCATSRGRRTSTWCERLVADGAEGVVLGCTEIELLLGPDDVDGAGLRHHPPARAGGRGLRLQLRSVSRTTRSSQSSSRPSWSVRPNSGRFPGGGR